MKRREAVKGFVTFFNICHQFLHGAYMHVSPRGHRDLHEINIHIFISYLLLGCRFSGKVFAALEINTTANQVYQLNFGDTKLLQKNIEVSLNIVKPPISDHLKCQA